VRLTSLIRKTTLENLRDWKVLILTLTFAPFFTVLMHFYFESASESPYRLALVNGDEGLVTDAGSPLNRGRDLIAAIGLAARSDAGQVLQVFEEADSATALARLSAGSVDRVVVVPGQFTSTLEAYSQGSEPPAAIVTTYGDPANPRYLMAAAWSDAITYTYAAEVAEVGGPVEVSMQTIGAEESLSEFDLYVPGLLALAVIMLMFTAAASIIKEKDKGTLVRLRISNMTTFEWLLSITAVQVVLGACAVALTLITALAIGYEMTASFTALILVSALSSVAVVGISVLVAAWLKTIFDLMTIGSFPFFILMFFSGGMFPLPDIPLFEIAGRSVNVNDILPTTHSISAFDSILNHSAGLNDVAYELVAISLLSVIFFSLGTLWFTKRHMSSSAV
jgi:ABC-2 type transport system permease protein